MAESKPQKIGRLRRERNRKRGLVKGLNARIKKINAALKRLLAPSVPGNDNGWHPQAVRVPYPGLSFSPGYPKRGVLHTTEGWGLPHYEGTNPHFTLSPTSGQLFQHTSVFEASKALVHSEATETNRAGAIQVEIIGFAKDSPNWTDAQYARIAKLMRWIEKNAGVPRRCSVKFAVPAKRMTNAEWSVYSGWCGHEHVPQNTHWDPGAARVEKLI